MKKITITSVIAFVAMVLSTSSCRRDVFGCIRGEGVSVTESRSLSNFTKVDIYADAVVYVYEDSAYSFSLQAQQNIIDNLESDVSGGKLIIRERRCVRHKSNLTIYIHAPVVGDIELNGSGHVVVYKAGDKRVGTATFKINGSGKIDVNNPVKTDNLYVKINGSGCVNIPAEALWTSMNINGSGKITTSGTCTSAENYIVGSGKLQAFDLETTDNYVNISGSGRAEVYATENLDVDITGSGAVYYKGWPRLNTRISGSGKVSHEN